jgi:hypothetical protein
MQADGVTNLSRCESSFGKVNAAVQPNSHNNPTIAGTTPRGCFTQNSCQFAFLNQHIIRPLQAQLSLLIAQQVLNRINDS